MKTLTDNTMAGAEASIRKSSIKSARLKDRIILSLYSIPFLLLIFVFSYIPLFGWVYSFFRYKPGIPLGKSKFIGFENFVSIFSDPDIPRVLRNTLIMSFLGIVTSVLPVLLAILLTELRSGFYSKLIQTTTTLPNFISWILVYSIAFMTFSSEGLVNGLLTRNGLIEEPLNILGNNGIVWMFQMLVGMWKNLGWNAIVYLATISGIDNELYDAASIDGAGRFRRVIHVTLPGLANTYLVLLLLGVSNILAVGFDQYFVFYNSMVADKIEVLDYYVYRIGIVISNYSYGISVGVIKTLISIILLFTLNNVSKRLRGNTLI